MLVALCSVKGSPGVTTTALALAACWPSEVQPVLVECDPAGGDLFARFRLEPFPGLVSLAAAVRGGAAPGVLWEHAQHLPGQRLPVVVAPAGDDQARAAVSVIAREDAAVVRAAADGDNAVVLADCGQVSHASAALPIIGAADVMLLLARPRDDDLSHVAAKLHAASQWSRKPCLLLVGDGYPTGDVASVLGIQVMGRIPHDSRAAELLRGAVRSRRGPGRTRLGKAIPRIVALTAQHAQRPPAENATPGAPAPALPPDLPVHSPQRSVR